MCAENVQTRVTQIQFDKVTVINCVIWPQNTHNSPNALSILADVYVWFDR